LTGEDVEKTKATAIQAAESFGAAEESGEVIYYDLSADDVFPRLPEESGRDGFF